MCQCEFCHNEFVPRPQVKTPRACPKSECQKLRQSANERSWHQANEDLYDKSYHEVQKQKRITFLEFIACQITACCKTGGLVLGVSLDFDYFLIQLQKLFLHIGVRRINKFWLNGNAPTIEALKA